jgi:hypothetical protein
VQSLNATVAKEIGVRSGTSNLPKSTAYFPFARLRHWYRYSELRLQLRELGSLMHRIRWVSQIHAAERLRGKESVRQWMDEALIPPPKSRQRAYIDYMRQIEMDHPFLSIFDLLMLSKAWRAGSVWRDGNEDTSQNQESLRS